MTQRSTQNSGVPIYCDDCGREKLAIIANFTTGSNEAFFCG